MALSGVKISEETYLTCLTHALSTETEEIMGLLLGDIEVFLSSASASASARFLFLFLFLVLSLSVRLSPFYVCHNARTRALLAAVSESESSDSGLSTSSVSSAGVCFPWECTGQ